MSAALLPPTEPDPLWDRLPGMVLLLDAEGRALHANAALAAFAGVPAGAWPAQRWQQWLDEPSRAALQTGLAAGADFERTLGWHGADGREACLRLLARRDVATGRWICWLVDVSAERGAQASAEARSALLQRIADTVPTQIAYYDARDSTCVLANAGYARAFGFEPASVVGRTFAEVIGEAAAREIQPHVERVLHERRPVAYERSLLGADGARRFIEVELLPHTDAAGEVAGTSVLISDITKHRLAEQAVRESEERLAKFMHASAEGIVFHVGGVITDANPPLCALVGLSLAELLGRRTLDFVPPELQPRVAAAIAAGVDATYEGEIVDAHGRRIPVEFIGRSMVRHGERMRMTIVRDIRDRQAAQARIQHLAHHDALTGLPNRAHFIDQLEHEIGAAAAQGTRLALLFIDLDHFKRVNDSLGHLAGDTLLRTVAARIVGSLRATDRVARFGGDEFVVMLRGEASLAHQRADVEEVARKLLASIEVPVDAEGRPISVTPSIGIALYPEDSDSADELIAHADTAMYIAKARGRANYRFFDRDMAESAYDALVIEGQLGHALERGELVLYFQPQARADDGRLTGAEALLRWNHPERGLLLPDEFIPVAERQRLMLPIGQWALKEAARCVARWHSMGLNIAPVAVNLSTVQFQSVGFVEDVAQVLETDGDAGRAAPLLELELTERMLMDDLGEVKHRLARLKAMGLGIAVDDFGTGYSSLAHLKELPIDKIKIDRAFVHDLPDNRDSAAITRAIIQMGASLGLTVIAEGVESREQLDFLARHGCGEIQGLLIGPALSPWEFEQWAIARRAAERGD